MAYACAFAAVAASLAAADAIAVRRLESADSSQVAAGRYVVRLTSAPDATASIDAAGCESAAEQDGVVASGSTSSSMIVAVGQDPTGGFRLIRATPGFVNVMARVSTGRTGALVGQDAIRDVGLAPGTALALRPGGVVPIAASLGRPVRMEVLSRAIVLTETANGVATDCFVELDAAAFRVLGSRDVLGLAAFSAGPLLVSPLLRLDPENAPERQYANRMTRFGPWVAAALIGLLMSQLWWARRGELALNRSVGLGVGSAWSVAVWELCLIQLWAATIWVSALSVLAAWLEWSRAALLVATQGALRASLLGLVLGGLAVLAAIPRANVMAAIKDL